MVVQVADMKNSVADRANAQVSCAAQFIGNHIESFAEVCSIFPRVAIYLDGDDAKIDMFWSLVLALQGEGKWLHIDMAYPSHKGERATGFGVALLFSLLQVLFAFCALLSDWQYSSMNVGAGLDVCAAFVSEQLFICPVLGQRLVCRTAFVLAYQTKFAQRARS